MLRTGYEAATHTGTYRSLSSARRSIGARRANRHSDLAPPYSRPGTSMPPVSTGHPVAHT
eukprot:597392-Rhodomonas_salina.1